MFGASFVDRIHLTYNETSPLADGWREHVGLYRFHTLIVYTVLFGDGYGQQIVDKA